VQIRVTRHVSKASRSTLWNRTLHAVTTSAEALVSHNIRIGDRRTSFRLDSPGARCTTSRSASGSPCMRFARRMIPGSRTRCRSLSPSASSCFNATATLQPIPATVSYEQSSDPRLTRSKEIFGCQARPCVCMALGSLLRVTFQSLREHWRGATHRHIWREQPVRSCIVISAGASCHASVPAKAGIAARNQSLSLNLSTKRCAASCGVSMRIASGRASASFANVSTASCLSSGGA
jgi:hypothetical protein